MHIETVDTFPESLASLAHADANATFYHTGVWLRALAAAYPRLAPRCLVAHDGGETVGYLPYFVSARGPLRALWSLPFGSYGGPVTRAGDTRAGAELVNAFRGRLAEPGTLEVGWVDFRGAYPARAGEAIENETHLVDLTPGFEAIWQSAWDKPRRRRVRRAEEGGVSIRRGAGSDDVRSFVAVYRDRLRGWDTGAGHPERLFTVLCEEGGAGVRLYLATHEGAVVGGHMNFYFRDEVIAWYGMTNARGAALHAGTLLYATCMREACAEGFHSYNLGASLGKPSLIEYKQSIGGSRRAYHTYRNRRALARIGAALLRGRSR